MHEIAPQSGAALILNKGQTISVLTPTGAQVCDLFCFNLADHGEKLSTARSIDYADRLSLTDGDCLYSNRSNPMLAITGDSCGVHDLLMPPCSLRMFQIVSGNERHHPSCLENLGKALARYRVREDDIGTTFNIFMNVSATNGKIAIHPPRARAGDRISMTALMDLLIGLTACSHEETNGGSCKAILYGVSA